MPVASPPLETNWDTECFGKYRVVGQTYCSGSEECIGRDKPTVEKSSVSTKVSSSRLVGGCGKNEESNKY